MSQEEHHSLELIQQAQGGDAQALDELLRKHLPGLRAFVRARSDPVLREQESASDLVQSACREALQSLERYEWRGEGSFRHWLFSMAMNKLMERKRYYTAEKRDVRRQVDGELEVLPPEDVARVYAAFCTPSQHAVAAETVEIVEAALDRIPADFRDVILLSRVVGLSHAEIAAQLGKNEGAVRTMLHRALARLTSAMKQVRAGRGASD